MATRKYTLLYFTLIALFGCDQAQRKTETIRIYPTLERIARMVREGDRICMQPPSEERAKRLADLNARNPDMALDCKDPQPDRGYAL